MRHSRCRGNASVIKFLVENEGFIQLSLKTVQLKLEIQWLTLRR
jgi:hypothetical protein